MIKIEIPEYELNFSFARSSGPGGQNVNKVNSKVILHWHLASSKALPAHAKERFQNMFTNHINEDGMVVVTSQEFRTQKGNIDAVMAKLHDMISRSMIVTPLPSIFRFTPRN